MTLFSVGYVAVLAVMWFGMWAIGNRDPRGWLVVLVCRLALVVWSSLLNVPALVPISLAFVVVDVRNYLKWRKERLSTEKVVRFIDAGEAGDEYDRPVQTSAPGRGGDADA